MLSLSSLRSTYPREYFAANAALEVLAFLPISILFCVSLAVVKQRNDPARRGFLWMKAAFPVLSLALLFWIIADALVLSIAYGTYSTIAGSLNSMNLAATHLFNLAYLLEQWADSIILVCFAELVIGIHSLSRGKDGLGKTYAPPRWSTIAFGIILAILALARFGILEASASGQIAITLNLSQSARQLAAAFHSLVFVASIAFVALAGFSLMKASAPLKKSAMLFLAATIMYFIRGLWNIIAEALWFLFINTRVVPPRGVQIADPILDAWLLTVILILLFVMGSFKQHGLWSVPGAGIATSGPAQVIYMTHPQQQQQMPVYTYGPPQGYPQYGAPQGQPQYGAPRGQPQYGAPQGQPQYGTPEPKYQYELPMQQQPQAPELDGDRSGTRIQ